MFQCLSNKDTNKAMELLKFDDRTKETFCNIQLWVESDICVKLANSNNLIVSLNFEYRNTSKEWRTSS